MTQVLILSLGAVPTPEQQVVHGDGLRAWGLATGLRAHGVEVTVGIGPAHPPPRSQHQGIALTSWQLDGTLGGLLASFDAVIVSYAAGELAREVALLTPETCLLVLDAYVPIFTEVAARQSADVVAEYGRYLDDVRGWRAVLERGDLVLCAHQAQLDYYTGILSSLGVINPFTFGQQRLLVVPFGLHADEVDGGGTPTDPYRGLGIPPGAFVLLWFGGLYPWFDIEPLLAAVERLVAEDASLHFVLVGGRNPQVAHGDFVRQHERVQGWAAHRQGNVHLVDWVEYDQRLAWLGSADLVVSLNRSGPEARYSWRTRTLDYVAAGVPLMTNGGDPLSDLLAEHGAAFLTDGTAADLVRQVRRCRQEPELLQRAAHATVGLRSSLDWARLTEDLARAVRSSERPGLRERQFAVEHHLEQRLPAPSAGRELLLHAARLAARVQEEGLRGSAAIARARLAAWVRR